jgi:hypothetical protein
MSIIYLDSFGHYGGTQVLQKAGVYSYYCDFLNGGRWVDGRYIRLTSSARCVVYKLDANYNEICCGFGILVISGSGGYNSSYPFFAVADEGGTTSYQVKFYLNDRNVEVRDGANTILGTGTFEIPENTWIYMEVRIKIHDTAGEVEVRFNEQVDINLSGVDTKYGTDNIRYVRLACAYNNVTTYFTDVYIDDAQFHGNCRVKCFLPDADGTHSDFTRSGGSYDYECVDEEPTPNDDTDYIYSTTKGHKSTFGITTGVLGVVKGIQVLNRVKAANSGQRRIKTLVRSGAADYYGPVSPVLSTTYKYKWLCMDNDPQDSNPWNQTKLEAAEFGLRMVDATTTTSTTSTTTTV